MSPRAWFVVGALVGAVGVSVGAYGAHGLKNYLSGRYEDSAKVAERVESFNSGVRYQMYHALALCLIGLLATRGSSGLLTASGLLFLLGVVLFSGFIYAWVLTDVKPLVHFVPFGGLAYILGWLLLIPAGMKLLR